SSTAIYTLSLHDALPIFDDSGSLVHDLSDYCTVDEVAIPQPWDFPWPNKPASRAIRGEQIMVFLRQRQTVFEYFRWLHAGNSLRSEEHTSELQSRFDLVC